MGKISWLDIANLDDQIAERLQISIPILHSRLNVAETDEECEIVRERLKLLQTEYDERRKESADIRREYQQ